MRSVTRYSWTGIAARWMSWHAVGHAHTSHAHTPTPVIRIHQTARRAGLLGTDIEITARQAALLGKPLHGVHAIRRLTPNTATVTALPEA